MLLISHLTSRDEPTSKDQAWPNYVNQRINSFDYIVDMFRYWLYRLHVNLSSVSSNGQQMVFSRQNEKWNFDVSDGPRKLLESDIVLVVRQLIIVIVLK